MRNAAIVATLRGSGVRCAELLALRPVDVDAKAGHLRVLHGKGDRARSIGIDDQALLRIQTWLAVRKELGISGHRPLFCTLSGRPLNDRYVRALLARLGARAGIEKRVHPHGLRHTLAYEIMMAGLPLAVIQAQLGHTNAAITSRYISHVAPKHVVDAVRSLPAWDET